MTTGPQSTSLPRLSRKDLIEAITEGVRRAMWDIATNATQMPCHDFYASIQDGVRDGIERLGPGGGGD